MKRKGFFGFVGEEPLVQQISECGLTILGQCSDVSPCGVDPGQIRHPEIIEGFEVHLNRQPFHLDVLKAGRVPEFLEVFLVTIRPVGFTQRFGQRIERDRRVPKSAKQLHTLPRVPSARRRHDARASHPANLLSGLWQLQESIA